MIKAIIFDYDGVIVDSFVNVFAVYKKICQHFGVTCTNDINEFRKIYGYNYKECLKNLGIKEENTDQVNEIFKQEIVKARHAVFAGVAEVIATLSRQYKLYVVSSSYSEEVLSKLQEADLLKFFQKIYCGADEDFNQSKSVLMKKFFAENDYAPDEVLSIGDRAVDYAASKAVDMPDDNIILVTYGWGLDLDKIGGVTKLADQPSDILKFVEENSPAAS